MELIAGQHWVSAIWRYIYLTLKDRQIRQIEGPKSQLSKNIHLPILIDHLTKKKKTRNEVQFFQQQDICLFSNFENNIAVPVQGENFHSEENAARISRTTWSQWTHKRCYEICKYFTFTSYWVIPERLIFCVILRHEKRKIQEIMDCENIGGFSHTTRIRRWPPYLTCVVIFENQITQIDKALWRFLVYQNQCSIFHFPPFVRPSVRHGVTSQLVSII